MWLVFGKAAKVGVSASGGGGRNGPAVDVGQRGS